jgi:hypothetical protein
VRTYVVVPVVGCLAAAALTVATTAPGSAGTPGASSGAAATAPVRWGRCGDRFLRSVGAQCGVVRVPMD